MRILPLSSRKSALALCDQLADYLDKDAVADVFRAYQFASEAHTGQRRHSGESYIHHPIEVAATLAELKMDSRSIIAALLHDVIEDTPTAKEEIAREFGEDIAVMVDGASKIGQIDFESKEQAEAENFRKMLLAMSKDIRVIIIKLADRLHNMRTLGSMRPEKQRRISSQTLNIYAPIANRLGLYHWSRELEDLCFSYMYPKRHNAIVKALKKRDGNRKAIVNRLRNAISDSLKEAGLEAEVLGRRKNVYSVYKKMRNKRRSFEELHDIYGFRIIVETVDECYRALGVIHNTYKPIPGRFSDYVAIPKENGYQSLHTVVFGPFGDNVEVQIRTHEMNRIAEGGVAAHWLYKSEGNTEINSQQLSRQWMLELLDPVRQTGNPTEFLEHLKTDLFPDEVYVFTPGGDIKKMPMGATALDFAYAVHTDVGMHSAGVRVNRELTSLPTVLNNGDTVEIITSKSAHPTAAWLNYAITGRARSAIHHYLKNQRREDALKLGKRLLGRAMKTRRFGRKTIPVEMRDHLLDQLGIETWDDLLIDIGLGNRLPDMVARQMLPPSRTTTETGESDDALLIRGAEGMLVNYARCCRPIPGDPLIGSFTTGHGLVVHTADCPNTVELRKQPDKCLMVEWHEKIKKEFPVRLRVTTENRRGVFGTVATTIAENESNINQVEVDEGDGRIYNIRFIIEVKDRVHLARVIRGLRSLDSVTRVVREKG